MRRSLFILLAVAAVLSFPRSAFAARVLVLGPHGHVTVREDRFVGGPALTPSPTTGPAATDPWALALPSPGALETGTGGAGIGGSTGSGSTTGGSTSSGSTTTTPAGTTTHPTRSKKKKQPPPVTFASALQTLRGRGQITPLEQQQALTAFNAALATERHLRGARRAELAAVTETAHQLAADHELWPSRLAMVEATLTANAQWWAHGPALVYGQRVMFAGSELEWEFYPGQGIQLQVLGSFSEANALYQGNKIPQMEQLLAELLPLASDRGGGLTWEYYFPWEGGSPPWTSAMSQGTALQALSHAYVATKNPEYLTEAAQALEIFEKTPAQGGVMVPTAHGVRFVQYSFTPGTEIINAFLQSLIGLDEYAQVSANPIAARLFAEGNAEAQWEVPQFNTGAWSLYQPGIEDDLSYHVLVTGFLGQLCTLTAAPVYCTTATAFQTDLKTPPVLSALTARAKAKRPFSLRFRLSKISHVGVTIRRGSTIVFATSATFAYGVQSVAVPALRAGSYAVTLTATDLAGNFTADPPATLTISR